MNLIVFIDKPEIRVKVSPGMAAKCATLEEYFEVVREEIRRELTHPRNFRIPADQIQVLARMYDTVKRRQSDAV